MLTVWTDALVRTTYLLVSIDVVYSRRDGHTCAVKDPFASRLSTVKVDEPRLRAQDGHIQHISHGQVVSVEDPAHDVGLLSLDEVFYSFDCLGTVHQVSGQAHVMLLGGREEGDHIIPVKSCPFASPYISFTMLHVINTLLIAARVMTYPVVAQFKLIKAAGVRLHNRSHL